MKAALAFVLALAPVPALAQVDRTESPSPPVRIQLDAMPLGSLVTVLMRDIMRVPYAISAEVLRDRDPVSVNLLMPRSELPVRVVRFLRSQGLTVKLEGGTVYVSKGPNNQFAVAPSAALPPGVSAAPVAAPVSVSGYSPESLARNNVAKSPQLSESRAYAVVRPAHRSISELADVLKSVLPGLDVAYRSGSAPRGEEVASQLVPDSLTIGGSKRDVSVAVELLRRLDQPRPQVDIHAVVFEVRNGDSNASALSLLADVGGVQVQSGGSAVPGSQFVRLAVGGFSALLTATKSDNRFKVVSEPSMSAMSGTVASINSGAQVPTLGSVTYTDNGQPVRSVQYRDSGLTLEVRPEVRGSEIQLAVKQERSTFARTTTGVDDSPTLLRTAATAQVAMRPGEAVLIAGLNETSESKAKDGILGGLFSVKSHDNAHSQLVLMLQADLSPAREQGTLQVERIEAGLGDEASVTTGDEKGNDDAKGSA